jgi:hypothetical protein
MKEIKYYGLCYFEGSEVRDIYFTDKESAFAFVREKAIVPNTFHKIFVKNEDNKIFVVKFVLKNREYIKYDKSEVDPDDISYRYGFMYDIKSIALYEVQDGELILKNRNAKLYLNTNRCHTEGDYLFYDKSIDILHPDQFCTDWVLEWGDFSDKADNNSTPFKGIIIFTDVSEMVIKLLEATDESN